MANPYDTKIIIDDRKAKKKHRCHLCKSDIDVDEIYTLITEIKWCGYYNKFKNFKVCLMHDAANIKIKNNKLYEV